MKARELDLLISQVEKEVDLNIKNSRATELLGKLRKLSSLYAPNMTSQFEKRLLNCTLLNKENELPQIRNFLEECNVSKPLFTPLALPVNDNVVDNLQNQLVEMEAAGSLGIYNCHGCTFKINNIKCSILIRNCTNCEFILSTSQLRICECKCCRFKIYSLTGPVIEESSELLFSSLVESHDNKWKQVRDFSCKPNSFKIVDSLQRP